MKARKVQCPRCGAVTEYSLDNPWRPFCSERCRMIDLGKWASEEYRVPEQMRDDDHDSSSKLPES